MAKTNTCSFLQKLSPELRNIIYELVLCEDDDIEVTVNK